MGIQSSFEFTSVFREEATHSNLNSQPNFPGERPPEPGFALSA